MRATYGDAFMDELRRDREALRAAGGTIAPTNDIPGHAGPGDGILEW